MKNFFVLILFFSISNSFAQDRTRNFIPLPTKIIEADQTQLQKWQKFNADNKTSWNIRWNRHTGSSASIFGEPIYLGIGDALTVAKTFLIRNKELFKINDELNNLQVIRIDERRNRHISFQQMFNDIPIYGALLSVHLTMGNKIYYVTSNYFNDVHLTNTTPSISSTEAFNAIVSDLNIIKEQIKLIDEKLIVLPYGDEFRLAWEVKILTNSNNLSYLISAENKEIFAVYDLNTSYVNGTGNVYDRHPNADSIVTRDLTNLNGGGYQLIGKHSSIYNDASTEAYETDLSFLYDTTNTHFDEVMAYYHTNIFFENYMNGFGYNHTDQIEIHVHNSSLQVPEARLQEGTIFFPDGDGVDYNDFVKEDVIIYHENMHFVMKDITVFQGQASGSTSKALIEAFADYFGCSKANTPNQGEFAKIESVERTLSNGYTMDDWDVLMGEDDDFHQASQILSGALWDIRSALGNSIADDIIFEGLDNIDQSTPLFIDACEAIIAADMSNNGAEHVGTILNIFSNRGILETQRTISSNTSWSGSKIITADITVASGVTLEIIDDTEIYLGNGASLIVYGNLDASCGIDVFIDFKSFYNNPAKEDWGAIKINGANASATFNHCRIQHATKGIDISNDASVSVNNTIFNNNQYGIYSNQAYASINNSNFIDCYYGLYLYRTNYASSQPDISNCNIYKSSYDASGVGIYLNYSSPIILNTEVYNYYTGLGSIYNSSPLLGHYTAYGNNNLHNNYKNIHAISSSNPFLGTTNYGGYNTFQNYSYKNIVAQTSCNIYAENNYWGSTNSSVISSGIYTYSGCTVDFEPFLSWNPNGNVTLPRTNQTLNKIARFTPISNDLNSISDLVLSNQLEEALTLCNKFIEESKETQSLLYAIDLLWQIERKMKMQKGKENIDLFAQLRSSNQNELVAGYTNLISAVGSQSKRIPAIDNVLSNYGLTDIVEVGALYSKLLYYLNEEENKEKAEGEYKLLKAKYPDEPITEEAFFALNGSSIKGQNEFIKKSNSVVDKNPTSFALFENYPNPFNPVTVIKYALPYASNINITVYNTLGQIVKEYFEGIKEAGYYTVNFTGENLSSGVYLYSINAVSANGKQNFNATKKMILMK